MTNSDRFRRGDAGELSSADLLRECGRRLTDQALWQKFQERLQKRLLVYLVRSLRLRNVEADIVSVADDLSQDVYLRLVQNDGQLLRAFKGDTEFSVMAFLARVALNTVNDYCRRESALKRQGGEVIPIDAVLRKDALHAEAAVDVDVSTVLSWIDVQRVMQSDPEPKNGARNILMLKLQHIDGLTCAEIAQYPGFNLTESGVLKALERLKARLKKKIE